MVEKAWQQEHDAAGTGSNQEAEREKRWCSRPLSFSFNLPQTMEHCGPQCWAFPPSYLSMEMPSYTHWGMCFQGGFKSSQADSQRWPLQHCYNRCALITQTHLCWDCLQTGSIFPTMSFLFWSTLQFLGFVLTQTFRTDIITRFVVWISTCRSSLEPFTSVFIQPDFLRNG